MEYAFLKNFSFDGKETSHLFQIAKVTIPFLSKENELLQVGNSNGSTFLNTRRTTNTIQIDGFMIKDNSGMDIYSTKDELVRIINTNEPKQLIFDMFPNRYFNAIYSGMQEYDATDPKYTPLTLTFDVPDGLAHNINPSSYTNVYATSKNLVLDSEYKHIDKYLKPWVYLVDGKYNGSNIVSADFTDGLPVNFERPDDWDTERWFNFSPMSLCRLPELVKGAPIFYGISVKVDLIDNDDAGEYSGQIVLEEWDTKQSRLLHRHPLYIDKEVTSNFTRLSNIITIQDERTDGLLLNYGFYGKNIIEFSQPMISFLPPLGSVVNAPSVGAKAYSNSTDFGNYDYSGNQNLMRVIKASEFRKQGDSDVLISDVGHNSIRLTSQTVNHLWTYSENNVPSLVSGKTYTMSAKVKIEEGTTGNIDQITVSYRNANGGKILLAATGEGIVVGKEIIIKGTSTVNYEIAELSRFYLDIEVGGDINGSVIVSDIKIEEGSTATPYQPNLLEHPYYLSKIPLGDNIADKSVAFPINSSAHEIYKGNMEEEFIIGQTYTITLKGTKPASQTFVAYNCWNINLGGLKPVEGLTDAWSLTFTPAYLETTAPKDLRIYQYPESTAGACQIDWLKIEKGDTRTPNIPYYKYEGIAPAPSNNPKEYHWAYSPSYVNAVEYVSSEAGYSDIIEVSNNGTAETYPQFTFTMNGENGLVGLLHEDGSILQFGNPENADGKDITKSLELGVNQSFWGNTLNPDIAVNTGFKSVWNPTPPNQIRGSWDMTTNVNSVAPHYAGVADIGVWHGPTMMMDIKAPYNNDRNNEVEARMGFMFDNDVKYRRGRNEFSVFDENGNPIMTTILSDANAVSNTIQFELWYKGNKLGEVSLNKSRFSGREYEIVMLRRGRRLQWNFIKVHTTNRAKYEGTTYAQVLADTVESFNWTLEEPDTSKWMRLGVWAQRYSNQPVAVQVIRHMQVRWLNTSYYQDIRNYFQDGDIVDIDVRSRSLFINGVLNNELNVVGNQWESFIMPVGKTVVQPVLSTWATNPDVVCIVRDSWN